MTMTDRLIDYALNAPMASDPARQIAQLSAVDWAACGIAGAAEGAFDRWARGQGAAGCAGTFAGRDLGPPDAALVNGTLSHALDFDDTHFAHIGHPSVVMFPALMAMEPNDWVAFERAALIGIEAQIRIGLWLGRDHYQRGFHQTATAGALGACLGLIHLRGLTQAAAVSALGLCATMASGLKAQFGTMGKPLNAGLAARAAVEAVTWAEAGVTGAAEGVDAFGAAHGAACDDTALEGLGTRWQIETLSHKFHACCHGLHATLEALRSFAGPRPERVTVQTHPRWMSVCNDPDPQTGLAAKFSYAHVVAMTLHGLDTGDVAQFTDAMARDAALVATRQRVTVVADTALSETEARVTLHTNGRDVVLSHDLSAPVDLRDLSARIGTKAEALAGPDRGGALWRAMGHRDLTAFRAACFQT